MYKNKKVAVVLANGFEEGEALFVVDIMRRSGIQCDTISIDKITVEGSHGIKVKADRLIKEVNKESYRMLVLPGGQPGADNLRDCGEIIAWVKNFANDDSKWIAAICAAPQVLAKAGVIKGKKVTSYPNEKYRQILKEGKYIDNIEEMNEMVVVDGNIITSRGPATTMPFAYKLVEALGVSTDELREGMLYNSLRESIK
ncbi:MAG: DJ-1/PfpI family protein [Clostridia bacterium]|nr:DJ-1/PfpI family protein [Clostridia bacterium]